MTTATKTAEYPLPPIDLQRFCDTGTSKYAICRPRIVLGVACATTGRILVRCKPENAMPFEPEEGKFPRIGDVMNDIKNVDQWGVVQFAPCAVCDSRGFLMIECDRCGGGGRYRCFHCEHEGDCKSCDGSGEKFQRCECDGMHKVGNFVLSSEHVFLIDSLPGVEWQMSTPSHLLYFRFEYGDGAVAKRPDVV